MWFKCVVWGEMLLEKLPLLFILHNYQVKILICSILTRTHKSNTMHLVRTQHKSASDTPAFLSLLPLHLHCPN